MEPRLSPIARCLRKRMTPAEQRVWYLLRSRRLQGFKFRRQHSLPPYVADFICLEAKIIVEVDGGQHLESHADEIRAKALTARGFRVIRFWNDEVLLNTDAVLEAILAALAGGGDHPHP